MGGGGGGEEGGRTEQNPGQLRRRPRLEVWGVVRSFRPSDIG